jgi:light-regulated signal transduction histidine kinase (bacteriophytochrome)
MSTELDAAQQEIARLKLELERARAELEEFTYSVSHDLRASLRHVTAYVQVIREDLGSHADKGITSSLETVSSASRRMGLMIDGLTEFSRAGKADLSPAGVDTAVLLQELRRGLMAELAGREVEWVIATDFPLVSADPALLRQVWSRLISNALKFSRGRALASIEITWSPAEPGFCAFHIKDNGAGFNPRYQEKLFKVFQRLHSEREFEGIGLGLAMVRKMVERHGGAAWAQTDVDAGCTVSFTLPLLAGRPGGPAFNAPA